MKIIDKDTISNNDFSGILLDGLMQVYGKGNDSLKKVKSTEIEWDIDIRDVLPHFKEESQIGKYKHKVFGENIIIDELNDAYKYEIIDGKLLFTFMYNMFKEIDTPEVKEYFRTKKQ